MESKGIDYLIDIEYELIKAFGWSLHEIDETDTLSLLALIQHQPGKKPVRRTYIDQAGWA